MHTANDSIGYLDGHIFRPPVYPLIIKICKLIGESYYIQLLLLFQILAGIYSVYLFSNFLRKTFSLNHWFSFVFSIVLLSPYLSLSKYNKYFQLLLLLFILTYFFKGILFSDLFKKTFSLNYLVAFCFASVFFLPYQITSIFIGNFLLSESFAYPLFLLTFMFLCEGIIDKNEKKVIIALVFNFFLVLTRGQFQFMYLVILLALIYLKFFTEMNVKKVKWLSIIYFVFIFTSIISEMTYHYISNGVLTKTPSSGITISTNCFYVSQASDSILFNDDLEKSVFVDIIRKAERQELSLSSSGISKDISNTVYNKLLWSTIVPSMRNKLTWQTESELYKKMDMFCLSISSKLFSKNWKSYLSLFYYEFVYVGIGGKILSYIYLISFLTLILMFIKGNRNKNLLILILLFIIHFLNLLVIGFTVYFEERLAFYTQPLFSVIVFSILYSSLPHNKFAK